MRLKCFSQCTHRAGMSMLICGGADTGRLHDHVIDDACGVEEEEQCLGVTGTS